MCLQARHWVFILTAVCANAHTDVIQIAPTRIIGTRTKAARATAMSLCLPECVTVPGTDVKTLVPPCSRKATVVTWRLWWWKPRPPQLLHSKLQTMESVISPMCALRVIKTRGCHYWPGSDRERLQGRARVLVLDCLDVLSLLYLFDYLQHKAPFNQAGNKCFLMQL